MTFVSDPGSGNPVFDYSSRDYQSILSDLLARKTVYLPAWTSTSNSDFGVVMLSLFAYMGDLLGYYLDRLAGEAFLATATQPQSILNLAAMLDYSPQLSLGSQVTLQITISSTMQAGNYPVFIPAGTQFSTPGSVNSQPIIFSTTEDLSIPGPTVASPSYIGLVTAQQGVIYDQNVATSSGAINQSFPLTYSPVSAYSFDVFVDLGLGPVEWTYVENLVNAGPFDLVYTNYVDANGIFYVVFGDGVNGYVPPLGSPITATYQTNAGPAGNVAANTITQAVVAIVGVTAITNPQAASGGQSAESITSVQQNAPLSLRALNRAVTVDDIEALAQTVTGVQWASAVQQTYQLVNLYIAPRGGGTPSALIYTSVANYIDPLVMANTTVTLFPPTYVPINIAANVVCFSNYSNATVEQNVTTALYNLLQIANTGFGYRVSLGLVYETILAVPGVNYAFVTELGRQFIATLTTTLINTDAYSSISVSPLPQVVNAGDQLVVTNGSQTQTLTASQQVPAGAVLIPVSAFTANATYAIGDGVQDTTLLTDAVTLDTEIPTLGTTNVSATGGFTS